MVEDIKHKIKKILDKTNLEECDVLYFLVEIGKLIERNSLKQKYSTIWFYRNWAAHPEISRNSPFIEYLKDNLRKIDLKSGGATDVLFGFITFIDLNNQIISFLHQQIEPDLSFNKEFTKKFNILLQEIISDIPISFDFEGLSVKIFFNERKELVIENLKGFNFNLTVLFV